MKIYNLNKGDLFTFEDAVEPLRFHGMDGMYARCSIASEGFRDFHEALEARRVAYISLRREVERIEEQNQ